MNEYLLLKFLHVLAFVYWLGGDLGTFLASRQVTNSELTPQSRSVALKIMLACDMGPKLAMPLILPLGLHLAWLGGQLPINKLALTVSWLLCLYWFAVVLILYLKESAPATKLLAQADFYFRLLAVVVLLGYAGITLVSGTGASWIVWKIVVFALMVGCGLAIRIQLKPFTAAFVDLMSYGPSEATNKIIESSVRRCRPFVWLIWAGLFLNAALGIHLVG